MWPERIGNDALYEITKVKPWSKLCAKDSTKTPEKDSEQHEFKAPRIHASCSLVIVIEKLVNNNLNLHRLLNDGKLLSKQLQSHVSDLQKELQILKSGSSHP